MVKTIDANKPTMDSAIAGSTPNRIDLIFSEDLNGGTVVAADFTVTNFTVSTASETSPGVVTLTLTATFSGIEEIEIAGSVSDTAGNAQTSGSVFFTLLEEGVTADVAVGAAGTASFSFTEVEQDEEETLALAVTLPPAVAGDISVTTQVEDDLEDGVDLATAVEIVAPCTNTCEISFTVVNSILTAAGLDPNTANIYHDSDEDDSIQRDEDIVTARDTTTITGSTIFTGNADFVSKFAVGGPKALAAGGGGGFAPSLSGRYFEESDKSPLEINGIEYDLPKFENIVEKQTVKTGEPVKFKFILFENSGGENVQHFEFLLNLTEKSREYSNSDTYIIYDKEPSILWSPTNQQESDFTVTVTDPNGLFENVEFDIESGDDESIDRFEAVIDMSITFAEAMPESDIYLRMWDAEKNSRDVIIKNVIEVLGEEKAPLPFEVEGTEELIIAKTVSVPEWIKNSAGWWSVNQINDETFVKGIEFLIQEQIIDIPYEENVSMDPEEKEKNKFDWTKETEAKVIQIPDWVKNSAGWWSEGLLSDEEFINAIKFLIEEETIMI